MGSSQFDVPHSWKLIGRSSTPWKMLDEAVEPVGAVLGTTCMVTPPGWSEAVEWVALEAARSLEHPRQ